MSDQQQQHDPLQLQPFLIAALLKAQTFVNTELEVMERSFLPEPNTAEEDQLTAARSVLEQIEAALSAAAGGPLPQYAGASAGEEGRG